MILSTGCSGSDQSTPATDESLHATAASETTGNETKSGTGSTTSPENGSTDGDAPTTGDSESNAATGTLSGTITFRGELPPPRKIQVTKDTDVCSKGEGEVQDVHVKDGKLAGAVVELSVRGGETEFTAPTDGFVIRQKDCRFTNPMIVAYDGAELKIFNDDPVPHNVNSGQWNDVQGPGTEPILRKITFTGVPFVRVTCNIHNWMETWVYVARTKFHAVSGEDGTFSIEGIPAGNYRGSVMHPTLGKQRLSVTIEAGKTQEANFEFEAP